ncbi:hypothetical protein CDO52_18305 [Nocardiopsis gilva YIM 90087]|uniref:Xaa-Pro dipeptidyl-peptidase-like domain-containing protein n=1 Tax=Nocardiopsis gilva YIM 90087 TaxID=1235441 RepID=A0A223S8Q7_9ACTN|nr:hypothetical protein CDO52_18305 [Nocardiopsis gilva YIM 90087]
MHRVRAWLTRARSRATIPVALLALAVVAGAIAATGPGDDDGGAYRVVDQVVDVPEEPGGDTHIGLDTSLFLPDGVEGRVPAVLVAHGFAGSKETSREEAAALAEAGYAVLTWTARGFGASGGEIGLNDPDYEVADVSRLLDWLAQRPEIQLDGEGDPRVGMTGGSYGGAVTLLAAGTDDRIDAIAPRSTYNDLADALFPDASGNGPRNGVYKQMWAGLLFTAGSVGTQDPGGLGGLGGAGGPGAPGGANAPTTPPPRTPHGRPAAPPQGTRQRTTPARRAAGASAPKCATCMSTPPSTAAPRRRCSTCCAATAPPRWSTTSPPPPCSSRACRTRCSPSTRPTPPHGHWRTTTSPWTSCGPRAATTPPPPRARTPPRPFATGSTPGSRATARPTPRPGSR